MRYLKIGIMCFIVAMAFSVAVTSVHAKEFMLNSEISGITKAVDKNGAEYIRVIIDQKRQLNGVEYTVSLPAMAFGAVAAELEGYSAGDTLKAVCQTRMFNGRESFTIIKVVK